MKIQCNSCCQTEAAVLCCADEAALCWACDEKVHTANKLAGKHQRVPLLSDGDGGGSSSSSVGVPKCDICQEASGYFFCLEDRALLCRKCDLAIHTANPYVSAHQRFLLTGVRVGLDPTEPVASAANQQSEAAERTATSQPKQLPRSSSGGVTSNQMPKNAGGLVQSKAPLTGFSMPGSVMEWSLDDAFFGFPDFNQNFGYTEHSSSKADSGRIGSSGGSSLGRSDVDADECLGEVPEFPWRVPEMPSPPTASGLSWHGNRHFPASDKAFFVPEIWSGDNYVKDSSFCSKRRRRNGESWR